ncbi:MAG: NrfD/PsrC family molybdoenzyme membrane anchor subunit [Candidatus Rokuibacteriota bacterium]
MEPGLLKSADWPLLIDLYFFLGGIAGGAFVIATIANMLDSKKYRDVVRVGYYLALLAIIPAPLFLVIDLGVPSRFLHMMMVAKPDLAIGAGAVSIGPFHLKLFSPMNVGAWGLLGFSLFAFLAALGVFLENTKRAQNLGTFRMVVGVIGGFFGIFIAAYPGVLLGATARPLFVSAHWLGAMFVAVGLATGGAAIALIMCSMGAQARDALSRLMKVTAFALIIQFVTLILFLVAVSGAGSAGISRALSVLVSGQYSVAFWLGIVVVGLLVPLALQFGGAIRKANPGMVALVSVLVLLGGFLAKWVIIGAGQVVLS